MKVNNINIQSLLLAGYIQTPPHCDDKNGAIREWIRHNGLQRFPRFHVKIFKNNQWNFHYDVTAMHGHEHPGSIITDGPVLEKELLRIKILGMREKLQITHSHLLGLLRKFEWLYGKKE